MIIKKTINAHDLAADTQVVAEPFSVQEYDEKISRQGKKYMNIKLGDKSGTIRGKVWSDNLPNLDPKIKVGDIVQVWGKTQDYNGKTQMIIEAMKKSNDFPPEEFLPLTKRDREEMFAYINDIFKSIENKWYKKLLKRIWTKEYQDLIKNYPAGEYVHHGYVGGMLEHYYEMLCLAEPYFQLYPSIDKELVYLGIYTHDIGKLKELSFQGATITRTRAGRLVAHLSQGLLMIDREINEIPNFPDEIREKIHHIIISHNGAIEYGSPILPQTLEAIVVFLVDDSSAKMHMATKQIEQDIQKDAEFSDYNKWLRRSMYMGDAQKKQDNSSSKKDGDKDDNDENMSLF